MKTIEKYCLEILTVYALGILVAAVALWDDFTLLQKASVVVAVLLTVHEWEETRFPGGFIEKIGGMAGLDLDDVDTHALHFRPAFMCFMAMSLAVWVPAVPFFACALLMLGVGEGIMHLAGIRLTRSERPYTPGMVTAEIMAAASLVGIVLCVQGGAAAPLDWALGAVWLVFSLGIMEVSVWRVFGMSLKDLPQKLREMRGRR